MSKVVKVLKIIGNVLLVLMIVLLSIYAILRFTNRVFIYRVQTGSMEQKIHVGDYILIVRKNDYQVGDVVTFTKDGYQVTHRIVKIEDDKITTKGDANNVEDDEITKSDIVGKLIFKGGVLNIVIKYKYIIVCLFLIMYLVTLLFDKEEKKS